MYRDTVDKLKMTSGLSSWEEAHSKLISLNEEQRRPIDTLEGEQLEELIAAAPLDLSVFNNVPIKTTRNSESPLDLSLKTRKRFADSTEEEDEQYWLAAKMHAFKRTCPGVSSLLPEPFVTDRQVNIGIPSKQTISSISRSSARENLQNHNAIKGELKSVCDLNTSVIKHGFQPSTNQRLQHDIPHLGEKVNNATMSVHSGYIQHERKSMFNHNYGNFETVKGSHSRNSDREYCHKQNVPVQQHHSQVLPTQDQSSDIQRQRLYKHTISHQVPDQMSGHSFQASKRRNPGIVVGTVCSSPSTILQYRPVHIGSPLTSSLNRHSPFVETVQRCSPDSTIPVNSPHRMSPNDIECFDERLRQMLKSDNSLSRLNQNKQISQQVLQTQKFGLMHYNEPMSPLHPGSSSSSSPNSPCIMSTPGEKSPMMIPSHGSPQSFLSMSSSPLSGRSQMYINHSQSRSRENSPLGVRNFPHSLSPLVHSSYGPSHSFNPQPTHLSKGRERSPTIRPCKAQERSILKGTSGMYRGSSTQVSHSVNDSQSIPNVCDKKLVISENLSQHYTQQTKGHIPTTTGQLMTQTQRFGIDKSTNPVASSLTKVKVEVCDQSDGTESKKSERRYMLKNSSVPPTSDTLHLMKIENVESSSCQQNEYSASETSKPSHGVSASRHNKSNSDKNDGTELERYSQPLTIAIPSSASSTITDTQPALKSPGPPATSVRAPRPFSKKQIIMNAFNNDEGLKKIVNSPITPRPSKQDFSSISTELSNANRLHNHSPTFPESPKMPTLSPQQKLSPAMVTPMTVEPPTLAPAATLSAQRLRQESNIKMSLMRRIGSFVSADVKSGRQVESETKQNEDMSGKEESRLCRHDHTILGGNTFGKRQSLKNIPIANVSPMVHGHSAKPATVSNVKHTSSVIVKASSHRKDQNMDHNEYVQEKFRMEGDKDSEQQSSKSFEKVTNYLDDRMNKQSNVNCVLQNVPPKVSEVDKLQEEGTSRKLLNFEKMTSLEYLDDVLFKDIENEYNTDNDEDEDKSEMRTKQRQRSLLQEIANSDGFVAENKVATKTDDLLVDPALLGREERALRRAIMQFNDMEETTEGPLSPKSPNKISSTILKADEIRRKARRNRQSRNDRLIGRQQWIGRRKRKKKFKQKGFIDFQPEVIASRTRTQAAGQKPLIRYDRNAAYERELSRDEKRKAQKRRERLRQTARRICRQMSRRFDIKHKNQIDAEVEQGDSTPEKCTEQDSDCDGMWEVGRTSNALKQTLRSGKSKGGLMLKLLFKPQKTKYRFGHRHSPRRSAYHLRTSPLKDSKRLSQKKSKCESLDLGSKLKKMRRRQQIARQRLTDRRKQIMASNEVELSTFQEQDIPNIHTCDTTQDDGTETAFPFPVEVKKLSVCRDTGETILHRAARMGYKDIALQCLQSGRVDVNVRDNAGYTPLHESCVSGNLEIANMLLGYGANVNCSSQDGIRPIHDAVENDNVGLVRMLLMFGADPTLSTYSGKTPLRIARSEKLQKLLEGHLGDLNGFTKDQQQTFWEFPIFTEDNGSVSMGIFSDIPSDPEEEEVEDHFLQTTDPTFTDFQLVKADGKETTGSFVLLNDVIDFHQVQVKDITNDTKLKSMFSNIPKSKLTTTSYGKLHSGRLAAIEETKCKVISVKELPKLTDLCKKQYSRVNTALDESKSIHKFKHYKCMKNMPVKSPEDVHISDKPEVSHPPSSGIDQEKSEGNVRNEIPNSNVSPTQHYSYFSHSRKIKLLPSTSKQQSYRVNSAPSVNPSLNCMHHYGKRSADDSGGLRINVGSREYHSKYLDFLKERECDYDVNNSCKKSKIWEGNPTVDTKKEPCDNNSTYIPETKTNLGLL